MSTITEGKWGQGMAQLVDPLPSKLKAQSSPPNTPLQKKLKIDLPYDPAIALWDIYLKNCKSTYKRNTCIPMFISAQFTRAKV
jgi:hypothetical protein